MTERLYDKDSFLNAFEAVVLECREEKDGYWIRLDRTAFFPEGGGQYGDSGTLGGVPVPDTQIIGGEVWHKAAQPIGVGTLVTGVIDWDKRFYRMQQHSGEHIVSGLIHSRFGLDNVGFHLGDEDVTVDVNGFLSREQLDEIEQKANAAVFADLPVTVQVPESSALSKMEYRSKLELTENVRIVTIEGIDACACCAPHVRSTGQIGLIKILDAIRYKQGTRMHLKCGRAALADYAWRYREQSFLARRFSVSQEQLTKTVLRLEEEEGRERYELQGLRRKFRQMRLEAAEKVPGVLVLFDETLSGDEIAHFASEGLPKSGGLCAVFSGNDAEGYRFAVAADEDIDLTKFAKMMNGALCGRGGGRGQLIRGSVQAEKAQIERFFEPGKESVRQWLTEQ